MQDRQRAPVQLPYLDVTSSYGLVREYTDLLEGHGVIVGPSDTTFGVFAPATDPVAVRLVKDLTGRRDDPLPLAVGTVTRASKILDMRDQHQAVIRAMWPGAMTAVAEVRRKARFIRDIVNPNGTTVGVRVVAGCIEERLSNELEVPIVSTAVRYPDGRPVRRAADALELVAAAMTMRQTPENLVAFTSKDDRFRFPTHSTVGELVTTDELINVLREGVYSRAQVLQLVNRIKRSWQDPETWEDVT